MKKSLMICINERLTAARPSCAQRGSVELADRIEKKILGENLGITVLRLPCLGHCDDGPVMRLTPGGDFLLGADEKTIMEKARAFAASPTRLNDPS